MAQTAPPVDRWRCLLRTLFDQASARRPRDVLEDLERLGGCHLWTVSSRGLALLPGVASPPLDVARLVADGPGPSAPDLAVVPLGLSAGDEGWLVCAPLEPGLALDEDLVALLAEAVSILAASVLSETRARRRERAAALADGLSGRLSEVVAWDRLSRLGLGRGPFVLVLVTNLGDRSSVGSLSEALADAGAETAVAEVEQGAGVLLAEERLQTLPAVVSGQASVGISGALAEGASLREGYRQASWALSRSLTAGPRVVRYAPARPAALPWLSDDRDALERLVQRTLGDLLAYDAEHTSRLLLTLRTYLDRDRETGATAAALHIHRHTLAYRLSRIEQLTRRRLSRTADIVELWLALASLTAFDGGGGDRSAAGAT